MLIRQEGRRGCLPVLEFSRAPAMRTSFRLLGFCYTGSPSMLVAEGEIIDVYEPRKDITLAKSILAVRGRSKSVRAGVDSSRRAVEL